MEKQVDISGRKVLVAIPCVDGTVDVRIAVALLAASQMFAQHGAQMAVSYMSYCSSVSRARNALAHTFMQTDFTDLLFIDDDTVCDGRALVQIVAKAASEPKERDVVCGAVPIMRENQRTYRFTPMDDNKIEPNDEGLIEVSRIGTAFMLIGRHVFEGLKDKADRYWVDQLGDYHARYFSEHYDPEGNFWGEDFFFCKLATDAGYRLWVDTDIQFSHVKKIDLTGHFAQDLPTLTIKNAKEAQKQHDERVKEQA